jgi:putative tryptophan/tyrosine transport system substrate-binding protein
MQLGQLKRREFITLLGGATAWPLAARAQQPVLPVIGFLRSDSPDKAAFVVAAFRRGLGESGYVEGQNVAIEYRWAEDHRDRLPGLAADLVRRQVAVVVGNLSAALAAKDATAKIPIVFATGSDPVKDGLVASLNRPGGNVTGISFLVNLLGPKKLQLLHELVPNAAMIALLSDPKSREAADEARDVLAAASTIGQQIEVVNAGNQIELDANFSSLVKWGAGGLIVASDAFLLGRRNEIVALAARHKVPAIYFLREFAVAGGLMSYGASITDAYRQVGVYAARILKGDKPANLPVQRAVKVELVINLNAAKALGLTFPVTLLGRADEVIE